MPTMSIAVVRLNPDARASQIQCQLKVTNESSTNVRLLSILTSSSDGAEVEPVFGSDLSKERSRHRALLGELSELLKPVLVKDVSEPRKTLSSNQPVETRISAKENTSAQDRAQFSVARKLQLSNSREAQSNFRQFLAPQSAIAKLFSLKLQKRRVRVFTFASTGTFVSSPWIRPAANA
jgi:hypothetical protein